MPPYHLLLPMSRAALLLALVSLSATAQAGLVVGGSRFIYPDTKSSISVELRNTATKDILVKVDMLPADPAPFSGTQEPLPDYATAPFIATPPLFVLNPGRSNKIRINRTGGELPVDRESLFRLAVSAIPALDDDKSEGHRNQLQIAVRNKMKVFYRPKGLPGDPLKAYQALHWTRRNDALTLYNPTPYFVTLYNLKINGKVIDAGMMAPFSHRKQAWCPEDSICDIRWQTLDAYSNALPAWAVSLTTMQQDAVGNAVVQK